MSRIYEHFTHSELQDKLERVEDELAHYKNNFRESCLWPSTIIESDQKMADGKPCKMAAIPNWCIHKIETNARKGK